MFDHSNYQKKCLQNRKIKNIKINEHHCIITRSSLPLESIKKLLLYYHYSLVIFNTHYLTFTALIVANTYLLYFFFLGEYILILNVAEYLQTTVIRKVMYFLKSYY